MTKVYLLFVTKKVEAHTKPCYDLMNDFKKQTNDLQMYSCQEIDIFYDEIISTLYICQMKWQIIENYCQVR